jgi:type III secretion system YscQ/HrcQ family protein
MSASAETPPASVIRKTPEGEVKRGNALYGVRRIFPFAWGGKPARLRFVAPAAAAAVSVHLTVRAGAHLMQVGLPKLPEPASLGVAFAGIEIAGLPDDLLLGVLETWLADAIKSAGAAGLPVEVKGVSPTPPTTPPVCGWEIGRETNERFLVGSLHAEPAALDAIAALAARVPAQASGSADTVPVAVHVAIARAPLPLATLRGVSPGDVIWVPLAPGDRSQGPCELWAGTRLVARAVRNKQSFRVSAMNPPAEPAAKPSAGPVKVDDLPVPVLFDVGQIDLTVGQLKAIAEGYTFELPATPPRLVAIRVNGREIGQGELVEIGDKVGVRVVQWTLA